MESLNIITAKSNDFTDADSKKQAFFILMLQNASHMICKCASLVASCFDIFSELEMALSLDKVLLIQPPVL